MEMSTILYSLGAAATGAGIATWAARRLASRSVENATASFETPEAVIRSAREQREMILQEALQAAREQFTEESERLDEERAVVTRIQNDFEQELNKRQSEIDKEFHQLGLKEQGLDERLAAAVQRKEDSKSLHKEREQMDEQLITALAEKTRDSREELEAHQREEVMNAEKLGISKWLIDQGDALKVESQRFAKEIMKTVLARYSPTFVWPKTSFTVDLPRKDYLERYFGDGSPLVAKLIDGTMTNLEAVVEGSELPAIKISGGAGVDKEVIRLTLEEILSRGVFSIEKVGDVLEKYRKQLDRQTLKMGTEAMKVLGLPAAHPEILKLIGALNFRTSHRQNQYFHTVEVARLAGMLADEVGVDHQLAKRSGLLHDIGKVLDYRIEGSHAVISGDYATRYGENEDVVDTVLSHHDDKIVETPFAYILKAADAMSGARPGARVDMEEGYQKRIDSIAEVVKSFEGRGILNSAIMSAGREIHVFVDNRKVRERDAEPLASEIARKLESDVQFPGQIRVTIIRRTEVTEVA